MASPDPLHTVPPGVSFGANLGHLNLPFYVIGQSRPGLERP